MKTTEIQAAFAALLDTYKPSSGQPTDKDLIYLQNDSLGVLVPISFDRELGNHNLMGLMLEDAEYKVSHEGLIFPNYNKRPVIYDNSIDDAALVGVCDKAKAKHQAKLDD